MEITTREKLINKVVRVKHNYFKLYTTGLSKVFKPSTLKGEIELKIVFKESNEYAKVNFNFYITITSNPKYQEPYVVTNMQMDNVVCDYDGNIKDIINNISMIFTNDDNEFNKLKLTSINPTTNGIYHQCSIKLDEINTINLLNTMIKLR